MSTVAPPTERLHALDAVRGMALMLGIVFHATVSFLPGKAPLWIVMDHDRSLTLAVVFHVLHIFRMTTFFLIAGFFAHMMVQRRGVKGFVFDRLKRIGGPLVVGWMVLFPAIVVVTLWAALQTYGGPLETLAKRAPALPPPAPGDVPLTHLWFLYLLLILYAGTLAVRWAVKALDRSGRLAAGADALVRALTSTPLAALALGAPLAVALCLEPNWPMWFGIPTPDSNVVPNAPALIGFGVAFGFGWLINRQPDAIRAWESSWPINLGLAVAFTAAGFAVTGLAPLTQFARPGWQTLAYAATYAMAVWTWTFAAIGLALKFLSGHSPARRYIADASYWLYLIHLPIVMALQVVVAPLPWPWWVKFPLILAVAFPVMFASYELMVRHSFIGAILNGRKYPWPGKAKGQPAVATAA